MWISKSGIQLAMSLHVDMTLPADIPYVSVKMCI